MTTICVGCESNKLQTGEGLKDEEEEEEELDEAASCAGAAARTTHCRLSEALRRRSERGKVARAHTRRGAE